jgi:hypothetical protein
MQKLIRGTKLKRGGLGITRMKDIAEIAYTASLCESLHRIPTRYPEIINIYSQLKTYQLLDKEMEYIMKLMPQILNEDQSNLVSWSQQEEDHNEIEIPTQKQLTKKLFR